MIPQESEYFPTNELFNNILFVWIDSYFTSLNFTIESIASIESESFPFDQIVMAHSLHDPSSNYTFLHYPLLKILGFTPISWPTTFKLSRVWHNHVSENISSFHVINSMATFYTHPPFFQIPNYLICCFV